MLNNYISVLCVIGFISQIPHSYANDNASARLEVFGHTHNISNVIPVSEIMTDEWKTAPKPDANSGFSQTLLGSRYHFASAPITIAYKQRMDYFLNTHPDTALGMYQERNELPLTNYERYTFDLQLTQIRAAGLALGYRYYQDNFSFFTEANLWQSDYFREITAQGNIRGSNNNALLGNITYEELYTHRNVLKRPAQGAFEQSGQGISFDFTLNWQLTASIDVTLYGYDLFNQFKFNEIGYTEADINTLGSFVENEGFSSFRPLLKGREIAKNRAYSLPIQAGAGVQYQGEYFSTSLTIHHQANREFYILKQNLKTFKKWYLGLELSELTPQIEYKGKYFNGTLAIDKINPNQAMHIKLAANWTFRW